MAALSSAVRAAKTIQNVTKLFANVSISHSATKAASLGFPSRPKLHGVSASFHTTTRQNDIMEFFDNDQNWGVDRVKVGRAWKKDELRIKSNEDLHKLWYILLKEKNMLLTMEHEHNQQFVYFPNPERLDKVEESMEYLEEIVKERNRAYHELETGEHGERPVKYAPSPLGLYFRFKMRQHSIPKYLNRKWNEMNPHKFGGYAVRKFLHKYREKLYLGKLAARRHQYKKVNTILRHFPNVDIEAIKAKYPKVNVEKLVGDRRAIGHFAVETTKPYIQIKEKHK